MGFSSGKCRGFLQILPSVACCRQETARPGWSGGLPCLGSLKAWMNWSECGNLGHVQLYRLYPYLREVSFLNALENCRHQSLYCTSLTSGYHPVPSQEPSFKSVHHSPFPKKNAKNGRQAALGNDPVDAHHDLLRDVLILACSEILHNPPGFGQLGLHRDLRIHLAGLGQG